jgi:phage tail-like protein
MPNSYDATSTNGQLDMDKLGENHFVLEVMPKITIGAFREITGLQMEREILEYAEGGSNTIHKLPGRVKYPNLVLKRGITEQDELMKWFWQTQATPNRKDVTVKLVDSSTKLMRTWAFRQAYPVKWIGPNLNAGSDSPATEQLELVHAGLVMI